MKSENYTVTLNAPDAAGIELWVHKGDLHMEASGEQNHHDLQKIGCEINATLADHIAFTIVPGDIADKDSSALHKFSRLLPPTRSCE